MHGQFSYIENETHGTPIIFINASQSSEKIMKKIHSVLLGSWVACLMFEIVQPFFISCSICYYIHDIDLNFCGIFDIVRKTDHISRNMQNRIDLALCVACDRNSC